VDEAVSADGPPSDSPRCPRCGGPVESSAPDDWYCREVFCGWEDDHAPG
jgi:tRNA(Ile2) C34 agmatinyltransferase TiaS